MNEKSKFHIILVCIACIAICTATVTTSSIRAYKYRGQLDTAREQLSDATDTNRELEQQLERCRAITGDLEETIGRNINTIRGAVETVEQLRYEIACLEVCLGVYNPDSLYDWYDSRVSTERDEGEINDRE